jgi:hypothetical protein
MLFDIPFIAEWKKIGEHRLQLSDLNTIHKNKGRIDYDYKVGQKSTCKEQWHSPQSRIQVSTRSLNNYASPYE